MNLRLSLSTRYANCPPPARVFTSIARVSLTKPRGAGNQLFESNLVKGIVHLLSSWPSNISARVTEKVGQYRAACRR